MKTCVKCGTLFKPRASLLRRSDYICKPCESRRVLEYRQRRILRGLPPSPMTEEGRRRVQIYRAAYHQRPEVKKRNAERQRRYARDPRLRERYMARWILKRRVITGQVKKQPCEVCGLVKVDAHHDDYAKPLEVRWFCRQHHAEHHRPKPFEKGE